MWVIVMFIILLSTHGWALTMEIDYNIILISWVAVSVVVRQSQKCIQFDYNYTNIKIVAILALV